MDTSAQKALANRLLMKLAQPATVTVKSDILDVADKTASVRAKLLTLTRQPNNPAKISAVMSATPFSVAGGELLLGGITYDILEVEQSGVGNDMIVQKVVLGER